MATPLSLEELKRMRPTVRDTVKTHREKLTALEHLALWITEHVGGMGFLALILIWTFIWLGWNTLGPSSLRFDPYPAFGLWLFIANVIQIGLTPLIMIGQNLQNRHTEVRADQEFQINLREEREIEAVLQHLENHDTVLKQLTEKQK
jgi:uncharacterized membrane protein